MKQTLYTENNKEFFCIEGEVKFVNMNWNSSCLYMHICNNVKQLNFIFSVISFESLSNVVCIYGSWTHTELYVARGVSKVSKSSVLIYPFPVKGYGGMGLSYKNAKKKWPILHFLAVNDVVDRPRPEGLE